MPTGQGPSRSSVATMPAGEGSQPQQDMFYDLTLARISGMIRTNTIANTIHFLTIFTILFLGNITCFWQAVVKAKEGNDMIVFVEAVHWVGVLTMMMIWMTRTWIRTDEYITIGEIIKSGFFEYESGHDEETTLLLNQGNDEAIRFTKMFFSMCITGCFGSMLRDPIFGGYIEEEGSEVTRLKFYNTWFPFAVNTWAKYAGVCFFQLCLGLIVLFQATSNVLTTTCCAIHLKTQLKLLQNRLAKSDSFAKEHSKNVESYEEVLYATLAECVRHHHAVIMFFEMFQDVMSLNFLINYFNSAVLLCAVGYIVTGPDGNIPATMAFLFVIVADLFFIGGNCYYGQQIIDESSRIQDVIYELPWYIQSNRIRFLYKMLMIRSKKPLTPSASGLKPMCFATFGEVLQAAYSYFNVLSATRK